jgi:hypothetical protein
MILGSGSLPLRGLGRNDGKDGENYGTPASAFL